MIKRSQFFADYRGNERLSPGGYLTQEKVDSMDALLDFIDADAGWKDVQQLAYFLATIEWETGHSWRPVREKGLGQGHKYGLPIEIYPGKFLTYYGRGYSQLTWLSNYARFSILVGLDLVNDPDKALEPSVSYQIMVAGMRGGRFTGHSLMEFIGGERADYLNARKIVNGLDQAQLIRGYAVEFERMLRHSWEV